MLLAGFVALLLQAAAAPAQPAPAQKTLAPPPPPAEFIAKNAPRKPVTYTLPNPPLVCGYETMPKAEAYEFVCRTQAEIDANKKKGATFSLIKPAAKK
jgi:hypothetical protein